MDFKEILGNQMILRDCTTKSGRDGNRYKKNLLTYQVFEVVRSGRRNAVLCRFRWNRVRAAAVVRFHFLVIVREAKAKRHTLDDDA